MKDTPKRTCCSSCQCDFVQVSKLYEETCWIQSNFLHNRFQNTWTLGRFKPTSWWEAVGVSRWTKWLFRCVSNAPGEDEGLIWAFQTDTRQVSGCHQNQNHEVPKKGKKKQVSTRSKVEMFCFFFESSICRNIPWIYNSTILIYFDMVLYVKNHA